MKNGWVKLYRKLLDNFVMYDPIALTIFIWILLKVNKETGEMTLGRKWASKELKLNEYTFYDALHRLVRHGILILTTDKTTIKYTVVRVLHWDKYQSKSNMTTQRDHNQTTIRPHIYKNRELRISKTLKKKSEELRKKAHSLIGK